MHKVPTTTTTTPATAATGPMITFSTTTTTTTKPSTTTPGVCVCCIVISLQQQQQQQQRPLYGRLSGTTRVSRYQKKHSPTHHPDHHPILISFVHLPRSIASSLFKLRAWQSFCTTSFHVPFGLPLGLEPSTSYSIHFFTQSVSSFRSTCPYHRNLFYCSINIIVIFLSLTKYLQVKSWRN